MQLTFSLAGCCASCMYQWMLAAGREPAAVHSMSYVRPADSALSAPWIFTTRGFTGQKNKRRQYRYSSPTGGTYYLLFILKKNSNEWTAGIIISPTGGTYWFLIFLFKIKFKWMNCPRTGHRKKSRNCAQTAGSMTWPALDPYVPLADHLANQRNGRSQWMKCLKQKRTRMDEKVDGVVQIATLSTQSPPVDEFSFRWRMNRNVLFSVKWKWFVKKFPASPNCPFPFKFRILIADWLIYRFWKFQPCKQNGFCEINFKVKRVSLFFTKIPIAVPN